MNRFVSTFINRIDAKGRVSIPAPFRNVLEGDGFSVEGKDWEWRGVERRIDVREGAKVTFDDAIRRVLQ